MKYLTSVLVAAAALTTATPALALRSHPVARPTLRQIDHCFYAPAPSAWSPLWPRRSPHPVHDGFNDMHGENPMYAHWAVDVQTNIARAKVYAMTAGVIGDVVGGSDAHFRIGPFFYYHAISRFAAGTHVARGQWVGRLKPGVDHVHLAETEPGCGLLDARRPTGPLRDPMNTEHPTVRNLRAYAANRAAYRIFPAWPSPDRSTPRSLGDLHGVVDLRANIFDMPVRKTGDHPQQPLMVAAVRSWLAPLTKKWRRYGHAITALDGARWISQTRAYYDVMAPGSIHIRSCFKNPARRCVNRYILHTAGRGLDTRRYPDRWYHYCVSALTIRNLRSTRCWPVRIQNHPRRSPDRADLGGRRSAEPVLAQERRHPVLSWVFHASGLCGVSPSLSVLSFRYLTGHRDRAKSDTLRPPASFLGLLQALRSRHRLDSVAVGSVPTGLGEEALWVTRWLGTCVV